MPDLVLPDKSLRLNRYPPQKDDRLQPWDAADEYLLKQLGEGDEAGPGKSLLLINDGFAALAAALADGRPTTWNDSHLSLLALEHNLSLNGLSRDDISFVPGDGTPGGTFDLVLLKFPKSLAWLEDTLLKLRPLLKPGSRVLAGGMIKHTPARAYRLLERIIGPTATSLGWKKARLATAEFDPAGRHPEGLPESGYRLEDHDWDLVSGPNVFSRDHLDQGTGLLLKNLPAGDRPLRLADLGCGNGVLALAAAARCPAASVFGVDTSYQAIASARENIGRAGLTGRDINFSVGDGFTGTDPESFDTVVCNPPFHMAQTVGDQIAWRMFEQSRRSLVRGGELRVVGNRHLGYHVKLKRIFGNCETLESDRKFVVLRSVRP